MVAVLNVVLPVFGIIFSAFLFRRMGIFDDASAEALNRFVYYIALPPLLFLSTARASLETLLNWPFIGAYLGGVGLTLVVAMLGAKLLFGHRNLATLTLHGMAAVFANTVYMGIPLFLAAFGAQGVLPVLVAALVSNLLFIGTAIVLVEISQTSSVGYRHGIRDAGRALLGSPVVMPLSLGLLAAAVDLPLPVFIENFFELLANAAGPTALFALGLSLYGYPLGSDTQEVLWLVFLKLLLNPLFTWWLVSYVLVLEPFWAQSAVLIAAIPTGALVFVIAQRYGVYVQRSAAVIVVTTSLSIVTLTILFLWFGVS